jgi:hypothetical protein
MLKEKLIVHKMKKLVLKLIKLGAKLDTYDIPFELDYQNGTSLKNKRGGK